MKLYKVLNKIWAAIVTWCKATLFDYHYWRVTYEDGRRTRLLHWTEARELKNIYGGKLWIDYDQLKSRGENNGH